METQHWITEAVDCGYLSPTDATQLSAGLEEVGRMLNAMMEKSDSFCGPLDSALHDADLQYFNPGDETRTDD